MNTEFVFIQPSDLDPNVFEIDPISKLITLAPTTDNTTDVTYTTSANVSGETALMFQPGQLVEAADPTELFIYCGVSLTAAQAGQPVTARREGLMTADTWAWTPDLPIFVGLNGTLTQVPPTSGWSRIIAYALEAQTIFLAPEHMIQVDQGG